MIEVIDVLINLPLYVRDFYSKVRANFIVITKTDSNKIKNRLYLLNNIFIDDKTLKALRENGKLPYKRINGKYHYKHSDVLQILQDNYYNPNFKCHETK